MTVEMITFDRRLQQELNIQLIKERKKWKKKLLIDEYLIMNEFYSTWILMFKIVNILMWKKYSID